MNPEKVVRCCSRLSVNEYIYIYIPVTSSLLNPNCRPIQMHASGSMTGSCQWMVCHFTEVLTDFCNSAWQFEHLCKEGAWSEVWFKCSKRWLLAMCLHWNWCQVMRSNPPEEVVLQMRKQDGDLEIVVLHYVPWEMTDRSCTAPSWRGERTGRRIWRLIGFSRQCPPDFSQRGAH